MTESMWTQKLLKYLRAKHPAWVIFKHADGFTTGVPDFSITNEDGTKWFEVKLVARLKSRWTIPASAFVPAQIQTLARLNPYGWLIVTDGGEHTRIVAPHELVRVASNDPVKLLVGEMTNYNLFVHDLEKISMYNLDEKE